MATSITAPTGSFTSMGQFCHQVSTVFQQLAALREFAAAAELYTLKSRLYDLLGLDLVLIPQLDAAAVDLERLLEEHGVTRVAEQFGLTDEDVSADPGSYEAALAVSFARYSAEYYQLERLAEAQQNLAAVSDMEELYYHLNEAIQQRYEALPSGLEDIRVKALQDHYEAAVDLD